VFHKRSVKVFAFVCSIVPHHVVHHIWIPSFHGIFRVLTGTHTHELLKAFPGGVHPTAYTDPRNNKLAPVTHATYQRYTNRSPEIRDCKFLCNKCQPPTCTCNEFSRAWSGSLKKPEIRSYVLRYGRAVTRVSRHIMLYFNL
jgi:hypothetical protein